MKKILAILLAFLIGFAAGRVSKPSAPEPGLEAAREPSPAPTAEPTPVPTPEPTPTPTPEPAWEPGYCRLGNWGLLWRTFERGDEVTVLGRWDDYYIIEGEEADLLVDMRFLRPEGEEAPGTANGWAHSNTSVYRSGYLFGTPIDRLPMNTEVRIVDTKANWMYIEWAGGSGYVDAGQISDRYIVVQTPGGSGGGDYAGGGYVGGGDYSGGSPNDGTDVSIGNLAQRDPRAPAVSRLGVWCGPEYESFAPCKGVILSAETEAYLCFLRRGDELKVTEVGEDECSILINGLITPIARWAVHLETDAEYEPWRAYTASGAVAYNEYQRTSVLTSFGFNDRVWVVDELQELGLCVVEIKGVFGYMRLEDLSRSERVVYAGGGGSGYTGGGSTAPSVPSAPSGGGGSGDWTPPNL